MVRGLVNILLGIKATLFLLIVGIIVITVVLGIPVVFTYLLESNGPAAFIVVELVIVAIFYGILMGVLR